MRAIVAGVLTRHAVLEVDALLAVGDGLVEAGDAGAGAALAVGLHEDLGDLGRERVVLRRGHREQAQLAAYLEVVAAQLAEQACRAHRAAAAASGRPR